MIRRSTAVAALMLVGGLSVTTVAPASADATAQRPASAGLTAASPVLKLGAKLLPGQTLVAGQYTLRMYQDGNLALHGNGRVLWSSRTTNKAPGGYATVRSDGAFAIRTKAGTTVWNTTAAGAGASLVLQTNGNLVLRNASAAAVWHTNRPGTEALVPGATLRAGQFIQARLNSAKLAMLADGRLVQYGSHGGEVWSKSCAAGSVFAVASTGALTVKTPAGATCWSVGAMSGTGVRLTMANLNNLVQTSSVTSRTITPSASYVTFQNANKSWAVYDQLNHDRHVRGLPALRWNTKLAAAARSHNLAMSAAGKLSHQLPGEASLGTRVTRAGYTWSYAAENVGNWNQTDYTAGLRLHQLMMAEVAPDDGHKLNILSTRSVDVGVDVYVADGTLWLTQDFGRPL